MYVYHVWLEIMYDACFFVLLVILCVFGGYFCVRITHLCGKTFFEKKNIKTTSYDTKTKKNGILKTIPSN